MPSVRSPLTLRQLSGGAYLAGILLLAVGVVFALGRHLDDHFRRELSDRGRALVERLAEDSRLALIQAESDSLRPRLETALADPNVAGIVVATARGETLAAAGPNPLPPGAAFPAGDGLHVAETEQTLTLVAAVRPHPLSDDYFARGATGAAAEPAAPLGFVALTLTKAKLQSDLRAIGRYVLAVMGAGALLVTLLALGVLDRLTRPIKQLARTMADPEAVRHLRQVEVRGVREARVIATAYNALIARVADSQADLARQVEEAVREVMRQNAELVVAREQAEAASRVKSQFVANMSHEIRTPMHGLMGALSLLDKTPLSDKQKSFLVMMREDADRLLREINGILDFANWRRAGWSCTSAPATSKPAGALRPSVRVSRPGQKAAPLAFARSRLAALGSRRRPAARKNRAHSRRQRDQIHRARAGSGSRRRPPEPARARSRSACCVRDSGIGIPPEQHASIFEPFAQADSSTTRKYGGSGLGLAICRQLVELMRGRVALKSRPGKGSTFFVELPLARAEPAPEPAGEPEAAPADALQRLVAPQDEPVSERRLDKPFRRGGHRVLVVDDERQSRLYAQFVLLELNAEVVTAASGAEALAACERQRFDLILMDVRMPDMDGLETTRRLRRQRAGPNARMPIIGLTADAAEPRPTGLAGGRHGRLPPQTARFRMSSPRFLPGGASGSPPTHPLFRLS